MADKKRDLGPTMPAIFLGAVAAGNLSRAGEQRPKQALELAQAMKAKGASPERIHAETSKLLAGTDYSGVHFGADGKPRFEVTDDAAQVRPARFGPQNTALQGDVLKHPAYYRAVPEAAFMPIKRRGKTGAAYTGDAIALGDTSFARATLAGNSLPNGSARGRLLHENQHLVQEIEGFSPGGTPDDFVQRFPGDKNQALRERLYQSLAGEVEAENVRTRANMTAAQRRRSPPTKSQAVSNSAQIVTDQAGNIQEQFGGDLPKGYAASRTSNHNGRIHYRITHRGEHIGSAYVRDLGDRVQMDLIDIDDAHQRKGISTSLYSKIETDFGKPIIPDEHLSSKAVKFWQKHRPEMLSDHIIMSDGSAVFDPRDVAVMERRIARNKGRVQAMVERKTRTKKAAPKIEDIGEKIGGARKDVAVKKGPKKQKAVVADERPAWSRRFIVAPELDRATQKPSGTYSLIDTQTNSKYGGRTIARRIASEAEAERMIPLAAVSQKHTVRGTADGRFEIWRSVTDRKSVKVIQDTFASRDEAMKFMAQNAEQIIGVKTSFGEEILARPEKVMRAGPAYRKGPVKGPEFVKDLGFRGVEFGNWNSQADRTELMNHAYDAMRDLAKVLDVDPKSLTMKGQLGLAFGARGHGGKGAAAAHYERDYGAINLTKMSGAGSLAHEWAHAFDHYVNRVDTPRLQERVPNASGDMVFRTDGRIGDYASHGLSGQAPEAVKAAMKALMSTMTSKVETVAVETDRYKRSVESARSSLADQIDQIRRDLTVQKDPKYYKRHNAPATPEQLARFEEHAAKLLAGEAGPTEYRALPNANARSFSGRWTNDTLDAMSSVMKEVRGRAGFGSGNSSGPVDYVRHASNRLRTQMEELAKVEATGTKTAPTKTDFAREALKLDRGRASDYWTTPHEMFARSFSAFVEDKAKAIGITSDFLSYGSDNQNPNYKIFGVKPFPEGSEREAITRAMQVLIDQSKATGLLQAADANQSSGLRGTQNPANLAAIVENRANAAPPTPVKVAPAAPTAPAPQAAKIAPPPEVVSMLRMMGAEAQSQGKSGAPAQNAEVMKIIAEGKYKAIEVMDAYTKGWNTANAAQPVPGVTDAATIAADKVRSEERFAKMMAETDKKIADHKAAQARPAVVGDNGGPSEQAIKTAKRLEEVAKRTIEAAQKEVDRPRLMNTARRARMGGGVIEEAQQKIADAKTALKIAEALRNGEAGALSTVKSLADIKELRRLAREAEYATDRKENRSYKPGGYGLKPEDVKNVGSVKGYVRLEPSTVDEMKSALAGKKGLAADFKTLSRFADAAKARNSFETSNPEVFKAVQNIANAIKKAEKLKVERPYQAKSLKYNANKYLEEVRDFNRKVKLAGTDAGARQEALKAFLEVKQGKVGISPALAAERALIGQKIPGFFPTPESLAQRMADMADIRPGLTVLEPSAGTGRLADAAKAKGANVDTVEMQSSLRDILAKKGHTLIDSDFTSMDVAPKYDRILMNPPFEKGQDMAHVKRAFEMLKPGGKMVAVMGEGGFFRSDKQSTEFRSWLDSVGGEVEKLPEGTFKESNTGVNTRLVTIAKPKRIQEMVEKPKGKRAGWSDAAREASADARASNAAPAMPFEQWSKTINARPSANKRAGGYEITGKGIDGSIKSWASTPQDAKRALYDQLAAKGELPAPREADAPKAAPVMSAVERAMAKSSERALQPQTSTLRAAASEAGIKIPSLEGIKPEKMAPAPAAKPKTQRVVTLGDGRKVPLGKYTEAWKKAKALPPNTPVRGTPSDPRGGGTAADVVRELRDGMMDRINQKDPNFGKGRKWDSNWQNDARRLADTLRNRSEVPAGQAHPVDLRPRLAALGKLEPGTYVPSVGGDSARRAAAKIAKQSADLNRLADSMVKAGKAYREHGSGSPQDVAAQAELEALDRGIRKRNGMDPHWSQKPKIATPQTTSQWLAGRENAIQASKAAGNKHLDALDRSVQGMRGVPFRNVHDPKERGTVRTVVNTGDVVVDWADDYSAKKNLAETVKEGKKTVARSWLAPTDLKDYVAEPKLPARVASPQVAPIKGMAALGKVAAPISSHPYYRSIAAMAEMTPNPKAAPILKQLAGFLADEKSLTPTEFENLRRSAASLGAEMVSGLTREQIAKLPAEIRGDIADKFGAYLKPRQTKQLAKQIGVEPYYRTVVDGLRGFANESTLNAALKAQGKAEAGKAKQPKIGDPKLARAAGMDAGNRSMKKAGRTAWNADDQAAATKEMLKLRPDMVAAQAEAAKPLTYDAALKAGHGKLRTATGDAALAATAKTLSEAHPGLNPKMVYEGAKAKGLTDSQLRKLSPTAAGDLMFAESTPTAPKKQTVAQLKAEAKAAGIKGASKMNKSALLSALGKGLDRSGAIAMVVAPVAAAVVAYDATKNEALAAGDNSTKATSKAVATGAVAGAATGAVVYGIGKTIQAGMKVVAKVAPAAAGPVGWAIAGGLTAYGAYHAYQQHKDTGEGGKAAALSLIGADMFLHVGKNQPAPAPRNIAPPPPQRLTAGQKQEFAVANEAHKAMQAAAPNTGKPAGWSDEARIAAYETRMKRAGKVAENRPYSGAPRR